MGGAVLGQARSRWVRRGVALLALLALVVSCTGSGPASDEEPAPTVDVAAGADVESVLLAETMAALLAREGLAVRVEGFDDLLAARRALDFGVVDAMPGYTGAAWLEVLGRPDPPSDPRASFGQVRQFDLGNDIEWLTPTFADEPALDRPPADATFAMVVRAEPSATVRPVLEPPAVPDGAEGAPARGSGGGPAVLGGTPGATVPEGAVVVSGGAEEVQRPEGVDDATPVVTPVEVQRVSQLATLLAEAPDAALCLDDQFRFREDGARALFDAYAIDPLRAVVSAPPSEAVAGVAEGACVSGLTTATDGAAWAADLRPLVDDRGVFPSFVVTVQARSQLREARPEVVEAWAPLPSQLTTDLLGRHNARVVAGEPVEQVARDLAAVLWARHAIATG